MRFRIAATRLTRLSGFGSALPLFLRFLISYPPFLIILYTIIDILTIDIVHEDVQRGLSIVYIAVHMFLCYTKIRKGEG